MLGYTIKLTNDDNGTLLVTCPALPEVTTFGTDRLDAFNHAVDAIEEALAARIFPWPGNSHQRRPGGKGHGAAAVADGDEGDALHSHPRGRGNQGGIGPPAELAP